MVARRRASTPQEESLDAGSEEAVLMNPVASTSSAEAKIQAPAADETPASEPWWMVEDDDARAIRQREEEARRLLRVWEAELGARQAVEMKKKEDRERWVKALEERTAKTHSEGRERVFTEASQAVVEMLPRIPRREPEIRTENAKFEALTLESRDAEEKLDKYLLQPQERIVATVRPHTARTVFRSLLIESAQIVGPMEWDDDEERNAATGPAEPPRRQEERAIAEPPRRQEERATAGPSRSRARRDRSRSRSSRRASPPPVIIEPPGVLVWELAGSLVSATGEGKNRKKNREYYPRRHLTMDDYVSGCLSDE